MDEILKAMISQGGLATLMLAAVTSYLLKKELAFAQERKDFNTMLEARNGEIHAILKEAIAYQSRIEMLLIETNKDHSEIVSRLDEIKTRSRNKQVA